ncbi:MAG: DsbE family thiol:disulfide interchange protein [Alphaproteobacteria bacterium]
MNKKIILLAPLIAILALGFLMFKGIIDNENKPDNLSFAVYKPMPEFDLPALPGFDKGLAKSDLLDKVSLVNVWGSWCITCEYEHPFLLELARETNIPIFGVDWREKKPEDGSQWLARKGNPYDQIGADPHSDLAIQLGITGAPETLVVDKKGYIRWQHEGAITAELMNKELFPLIKQLQEEQ